MNYVTSNAVSSVVMQPCRGVCWLQPEHSKHSKVLAGVLLFAEMTVKLDVNHGEYYRRGKMY